MSEACLRREMTQHTSDERVGGCLKRTKSITNNEDGHAESSKGLGLDAWNRNQCADGIQAKTPDENSLV